MQNSVYNKIIWVGDKEQTSELSSRQTTSDKLPSRRNSFQTNHCLTNTVQAEYRPDKTPSRQNTVWTKHRQTEYRPDNIPSGQNTI